MLDTIGHEASGAGLCLPSGVVNLVLVAFLLEDMGASVIKHKDVMVVVETSSSDPALGVDRNAVDATGIIG